MPAASARRVSGAEFTWITDMINPDNLNLASNLPTFVNPTTTNGTITISGTVNNGVTANFTGTITSTIPANLFKADIYGANNVTNTKVLLNTLLTMTTAVNGYLYKSSELCQVSISYSSASVVTVKYSIFNGTGANITLNTQTITLTLAEYQVPF